MLAILKITAYVLGHIPLFMINPIGRMLGAIAFAIDKKRRAIAIENLKNAYKGEIPEHGIREIAKKAFQNLAITALEFSRLPWLKRENIDNYVECEGTGVLEKALQRKKGVILLTAHYGNWELLVVSFGLKGFNTDVVVREIDSPVLEEFVKWTRTRCGNSIVPKQRAMRRLLKSLSEGKIVIILLDQNVTWSEGVFVDFFGIPACTNKGLALLQLASNASVVPAFIERRGRTHRLVIEDPVELSSTGNKGKDTLTNTQRCTKIIEDRIRKAPDNWFWVHRRWKTRPKTEAQGLTKDAGSGII